ncbi:MAG: AAA family ATPase [Endomicrobium sp.]|jgi:hypothetical protein|nr:AAA family ATPase [Endomicrobium sp.]
MRNIHLVLQAKGGVGKSFIASLIAQFLQKKENGVICIDIDPNNQTLYSFKALKVKTLKLLDDKDKIDERAFDRLIDFIFNNENIKQDFVVDSGTTTFIPFVNYLIENQAFDILLNKFKVYIHIPIVGAQGYDDTLIGLEQLIKYFKNKATFFVWLNEYHGKIQNFETSKIFAENKKYIDTIIRLDTVNKSTFGKDLEDLTKANLTFEEAEQNSNFSLMTKQRLKIYSRNIFEQLANSF